MFVTSSEHRSGLLAAVITGGRPRLSQRPTAKFLAQLEPLELRDIVWVVSEADAPAYERDGYPLCVYPTDWAYTYAAEHWMHLDPPKLGGFLGAFPGREWACLEAERRGCWGVLQLDDNIDRLSTGRPGASTGTPVVARNGGLGLFADLLAATVLSTNGRSIGASLGSSPTVPSSELRYARAGFPYSLFVEQVGDGREHWYGPFEDDITHAYQYGTRADGVTAGTMPMLHYRKESKAKTGMRTAYSPMRAVQLQRIFPETAKLNIRKTRSNGRGDPRIFHTMIPGAIRNKLTITDPVLFKGVQTSIDALLAEWHTEFVARNRAKVMRRAASVGRAKM